MRHRVSGYKLGRNTPHRKALFRNLAAALLQHGRITTTAQKAKAVQPYVEKLISLAKKGDLAARRQAIATLQDRQQVFVIKGGREDEEVADKSVIQKLFDELGPRYADRNGGYTRIVKLARHRIGDGADLVVLQLVSEADDGANVAGRYSRRRQKQDNRTAFAAKLRKARSPGVTASAPTGNSPEPTAPAPDTTVATESAPTDSPEAPPESTDAPDDSKKPE